MSDHARPYHKAENLIWDTGLLDWVPQTASASSGGDGALLDGVSAAIRATVKSYTNANPLTVITVDTSGNPTSAGGTTQYAEDTASAAGEQLVMVGVVRKDTRGTIASATGNRSELQVNASGDLRVDGSGVTQPISVASLPLPSGAATESTLGNVLTQSDFDTKAGSLTEAAPASDTASSGLNGRLQRIAQRLTSLIAQLPAALAASGGLKVDLSGTAANTNKILVTPDSVALPANQSVNVTQLAGTATSVNSGVKDAGTLRVVLATDQPQLTNKLLVTPDANSAVNVAQVGGAAVALGQAAAASSIPMVPASDWPGPADTSLSSTINGAAQTFAVALAGQSGVAADLEAGTLAATLVYEHSFDGGTNYVSSIVIVGVTQNSTGSTFTNPNANTTIIWFLPPGASHARVRVSAYTSGSAAIKLRATKVITPLAVGALTAGVPALAPPIWANVIGGTDGSVTRMATVRAASSIPAASDTGLVVDMRPGGVFTAAAASADALTNPTISQIGADAMLFNGTSWDRQRGAWNTTTGDTGAKATGAFLGAAQTNYNARGAIITCLLGTVTGAVTTFQTGIQWSFDGGTTWLELTPLGANDTAAASGRTYTWIIYPTNTSQAAGTTPANLAPGTISVAGPTQLNVINAALPRTWRFAASITVATSIVITSVNVNYLL